MILSQISVKILEFHETYDCIMMCVSVIDILDSGNGETYTHFVSARKSCWPTGWIIKFAA